MRIIMVLLQAGGLEAMSSLIFPLAIILVMYFFFIRPQNAKQKAQQDFSSNLSKGSDVVTSSGILGKITKIDGDIITLLVDNKTHLRVTRGAISKDLTESVYKPKATTEATT